MKRILFRHNVIIVTALFFAGCGFSLGNGQNDAYVRQIEEKYSAGQVKETLELIKSAPSNEDKPISQWLEQHAPELEPIFLYILAEKKFETDKQAALRWYMTARLRAYYDAFRCEDISARSGLSLLPRIAPKTAQYLADSEANIEDAGQKALAWDAEHPVATSPKWICGHGMSVFTEGTIPIKPESEWPEIYKQQRDVFQKSLEMTISNTKSAEKLSDQGIFKEIGTLTRTGYGEAFLLADNQILFLGSNEADPASRGVERFDTVTGKTEILPVKLGKLDYEQTITRLNDGTILFAASDRCHDDHSNLYNLDAEHNKLSESGQLSQCRHGHTATLLPDGTVLFIGGRSGTALNSIERYDPVTKKSRVIGTLLQPREQHKAVLLPNGEIIVLCGEGFLPDRKSIDATTVEIFNPKTGKSREVGHLLAQRSRKYSVTLLKNGKVLIIGGISSILKSSSPKSEVDTSATAELFDPISGKSLKLPDTKGSRVSHTATLLPDGRVFIFGPEAYGKGLSSAEMFSPEDNTFEKIADVRQQRINPSSILTKDGNVLIVGGGPKSVLLFNPTAWDQHNSNKF